MASNIFSASCIMRHMALMKAPYLTQKQVPHVLGLCEANKAPDDLSTLAVYISEAFKNLISRCWKFRPESRSMATKICTALKQKTLFSAPTEFLEGERCTLACGLTTFTCHCTKLLPASLCVSV